MKYLHFTTKKLSENTLQFLEKLAKRKTKYNLINQWQGSGKTYLKIGH